MVIMGGSSVREAVVKTGDLVEGRYRIIQTLGAGGMGTVFLAEHVLIKRRVALKILHADLATDDTVVERFMNEARAAGTLGHPNIVESTDMGFTHEHVPYIVYEYLEGTLLTDEIYRVGGLPVRRAVRIAEQIASALQAAHNANIVHRDLKSDNIFLTDKDDALDHVKVLDFGVSRFLETAEERTRAMVVGTPEFMSPEQITDPENVDRRADVYALGVMLYEMLTARRPFSNDEDPRQLMHRIVHEAPPPLQRPEVPHGLETMVMKLLSKDRRDRYSSMADVQAALSQFITGGTTGPIMRRRSAPIVVPSETFDDPPQTSVRLPKPVTARPATPVPARDTPWPVQTIDTALSQVSLPPAPAAKRAYVLYGAAAGGILIGTIGLIIGLRGGEEARSKPTPTAITAPAPAPAPAAATQPPKPEKVEVQLDADVANARIVFRRRINAAPTVMEINPTDVVELVEVSAPGYKTTRYWLTFDRPTYLKAHLVRGTGSFEATEEDTLVALGEVIMVKGNAPSQAAVAAAAPREETKAPAPAEKHAVATAPSPVAPPPAMAPRKIGKSAADEETKETKVALKEEKNEKPAGSASPGLKAAVEEPKLPEPPKEEPKPAPAPTPTEAPKVAAQEPAASEGGGTIDNATVSSVVTSHRPEVIKCFAEGKKKNPAMKGVISVQLQVDPAGKIHRVQIQSTLNNPLVAACVAKAANGWTFPRRNGGDLATVSYPFTIN